MNVETDDLDGVLGRASVLTQLTERRARNEGAIDHPGLGAFRAGAVLCIVSAEANVGSRRGTVAVEHRDRP